MIGLTIGCHVIMNDRVCEVIDTLTYNFEGCSISRVKCKDKDGNVAGGFVENIQPIEITPELLESLGFKATPTIRAGGSNSYQRCLDDNWLNFNPLNKCGDWECLCDTQKGGHLGRVRYIKYLHQAETFLNIFGIPLWNE